jgi:hypothetical protein
VAITNGYATLAEFREHIGDTASVATAAVAVGLALRRVRSRPPAAR